MLAKIRTPAVATCKGALQLEATLFDVKENTCIFNRTRTRVQLSGLSRRLALSNIHL